MGLADSKKKKKKERKEKKRGGGGKVGPWIWPSGSDQIMCSLHPVVHMFSGIVVKLFLLTCLWREAPTSVTFMQCLNQQ